MRERQLAVVAIVASIVSAAAAQSHSSQDRRSLPLLRRKAARRGRTIASYRNDHAGAVRIMELRERGIWAGYGNGPPGAGV